MNAKKATKLSCTLNNFFMQKHKTDFLVTVPINFFILFIFIQQYNPHDITKKYNNL